MLPLAISLRARVLNARNTHCTGRKRSKDDEGRRRHLRSRRYGAAEYEILGTHSWPFGAVEERRRSLFIVAA